MNLITVVFFFLQVQYTIFIIQVRQESVKGICTQHCSRYKLFKKHLKSGCGRVDNNNNSRKYYKESNN